MGGAGPIGATGERRWPDQTWRIVLVPSAVVMITVAWTFNLIGFSLNY
jgi:ABC-type dipeptide/oligopeptide/nickel transport system permease subunit